MDIDFVDDEDLLADLDEDSCDFDADLCDDLLDAWETLLFLLELFFEWELTTDLEDLETVLADFCNFEDLETDLCDFESDLCELETDLCDLEADLCDLEADAYDFVANLFDFETELCDLEADLCELEADLWDLEASDIICLPLMQHGYKRHNLHNALLFEGGLLPRIHIVYYSKGVCSLGST